MKKVILCVIFLFSVLDAHAQDEMVRIPYTCTYRVQPGDTLIGIAGSDFLEVYENNLEKLASGDPFGKASPNHIVSGTRLKIPEGICVSSKIARAINAQRLVRRKAFVAIDEAEKGQKALRASNGSSPRGDSLLEEARSLAQEQPGYANPNYLQAYERAVSAERYFADAEAILNVQVKLEEIEKKVESQSRGTAGINGAAVMSYPRWPWLAGLAGLGLLIGVVCVFYVMSRFRQRERTAIYIQERLAHHQKRLVAFSHPCR